MARQAATQWPAEQLDLFGGFVASVLAVTLKRPRLVRQAANAPRYVQLELVYVEVELLPRLELTDEDLEDVPVEPFRHSIVSAADCKMPKGLGPASIFSVGASAVMPKSRGRARPAQVIAQIHRVIQREDGRLIHQSIRVQETDEWKEKEERRRARQKPPKPPKQKFKTKGSRVWADARN